MALVAAVALHEAIAHIFSPPWTQGGAGGGYVSGKGTALHTRPASREGGLLIKWPNDILLAGAKLAGILLEREGEAVVIGIGVNLAHAPEGLDRPAASLGGAAEPAPVLEMLAETFGRWLARWRTEGLAPIRARWLAAAHPRGTALTTSEGEGLFDGLDEDGALRLRLADGTVRVIHAGDVFLI